MEAQTVSTTQSQLEVQVVVFSLRENRLQVLLLPAESKGFAGQWTLPGSGISENLSLEETATACLARYICRHKAYLEQLYTYGERAHGSGQRVISVVYFALIPSDAFCSTGESAAAAWFPVDALPQMRQNSGEVIAYALRRLRYKLEYTAAGFELLPEYFTLSQLQQTYEMVLGEKLDKRNFRRRILEAGIIEPTSSYRSGEGRPALLYRYRPDAVAEVKARRLFP